MCWALNLQNFKIISTLLQIGWRRLQRAFTHVVASMSVSENASMFATSGAVAGFAWGIFSWHVSCAVKPYFVWVITCHRKPRALFTPQSCLCCCFSIPSPIRSLSLSNPCHPFVLFLSLLFSRAVYLAKKMTPGSWGWWFLWSVYYICVGFSFLRILKAIFDLKTSTVGLHEILARPGCHFHF